MSDQNRVFESLSKEVDLEKTKIENAESTKCCARKYEKEQEKKASAGNLGPTTRRSVGKSKCKHDYQFPTKIDPKNA